MGSPINKRYNSSRSTKVDDQSRAVISKVSAQKKCSGAMVEKCSGFAGTRSHPEVCVLSPRPVTRCS